MILIIQRKVLPGITIVPNEWKLYSSLKDIAYNHLTVNHFEHFVYPINGTNTQSI